MDNHRSRASQHVLVTGFGPFGRVEENPSWLAVKKLHNICLYYDFTCPDPSISDTTKRAIHITILQVPVSYETVLSVVPSLHQRPPVWPESDDPQQSPPDLPQDGFDFFLHVGVANRDRLSIERLAHKLNYDLKDHDGKLAPIAYIPDQTPEEVVPTEAQRDKKEGVSKVEQLSDGLVEESNPEMLTSPVRGFGKEYKDFPEEMLTDIDIEKLVHDLQRSGTEDVVTTCYSSDNAGRYLCDYIYYCSLAESKRATTEQGENSKVLFVHCPPLNEPFTTEDVAEALKRIIVQVCEAI